MPEHAATNQQRPERGEGHIMLGQISLGGANCPGKGAHEEARDRRPFANLPIGTLGWLRPTESQYLREAIRSPILR